LRLLRIVLLQFPESALRNVMPPNRETVIRPASFEADRFDELRGQIDAMFGGPQKPYLLGPDGERIVLPDSALEALRVIVDTMAQGRSITLVPHDKELTSQEAADVLHVSRPHLIKLLDRGELPFHRVGTHRRIRIEDVLAYRDRRDAEREAALGDLARLSEELPGGYR
jgi:excisionase family DNA binding protein